MHPALGLAGAAAGGGLLLRNYLKRRKRMKGARQVTGYKDGKPFPLTVVPVLEGNPVLMEAYAAEALRELLQAARAAGHPLTLTSGWRSNEEQKALHQKYLSGTGNLAARPGYSNHQGGIAVDLGGVVGFHTAAYAWLSANAHKYGFENDVPGEHWHWTHKGSKARKPKAGGA